MSYQDVAAFKIPYARFFDEEAGFKRILLPDAKPRSGYDAYDPQKHHGNLLCPDCDAHVHYHPGAASRLGDNAGRQREHFKTSRGQSHKGDCDYRIVPAEKIDYDASLGYRIHVNLGTYSGHFNRAAGPYTRDEDGRPKLREEFARLAAFEPHALHSVSDLVDLLKRGETDRLKQSKVIFRDQVADMSDFLIRYARRSGAEETRFLKLYDRLKDNPAIFCAMELQTKKSVAPYSNGNREGFTRGVSKSIFLMQDDARRKHYLVPRLFLDRDENGDHQVDFAMQDAGHYLAIGYARLGPPKSSRDGRAVFHHINMSVSHASDLMAVDLGEIAGRARANGARREARQLAPGAV